MILGPAQLERPSTPACGHAGVCDHCGLPARPRSDVLVGERVFCCAGCAAAYEIIHACGLERYYRLRERAHGTRPAAERASRGTFSEFDDATFARLYVRPRAGGLLQTELYLDGVHCAACVWLVERLPKFAPGVAEARLNLPRSLVRVAWDPAAIKLSGVARALDSIGYTPHPARGAGERELRRLDDRRFLVRIGVAGACAGNVMLLALALYSGAFAGMEAEFARLFRWLSAGFGLLAVAWPGSVFFRGAWAALRTRTAHLDVPIALALFAGCLAGAVNVVRDAGEIYFDSLATLVFLLLAGRWIQRRTQRAATDAVELLHALTPSRARLVESSEDGETVCDVPVEAVSAGQTIEVRAGETVPVDGTVLAGTTQIDLSLLSGEPWPVDASPGDRVAAGTVNLSGVVRVRVEATGEATRVGRLMRAVEEASARRAEIVRIADRVAGRFVLIVLALAALTAGGWWFVDPARAIEHAVALLVVTCPCALGLATPLVVSTAIGRAARSGALIKGGDAIERLSRPGALFLDKTGTVTAGRITVVEREGDPLAMSLAAALEACSSHPLARALARDLAGGFGRSDVEAFSEAPGAGVEGRVSGRRVVVGSLTMMARRGVTVADRFEESAARMAESALSPILIAIDGEARALVGLGDEVRSDARASIARLRAMGWDLHLLSGDRPETVRAVGRDVGLAPERCEGGAAPERKLAVIREAGRRSTVVMVGDGVNDATALAAADVGIAVHGGAEACLSAADIYLTRPGMGRVVEVIEGSARTIRAIRRCMLASLCYNSLAAGLAVCGLIGPIMAAVLMPISSFTVLTIALRSRTFREGEPCR